MTNEKNARTVIFLNIYTPVRTGKVYKKSCSFVPLFVEAIGICAKITEKR